jgi:DNA-binding CsgD family transcriptional regulator
VSYATIPPEMRQVAERILTRKQLDVFKLSCAGAGSARIAIMLDIAESTARSHLRRAHQKIKLEMEREAA